MIELRGAAMAIQGRRTKIKVIAAIIEADNDPTTVEIADAIGKGTKATARHLNELENEGVVEIYVDKENKVKNHHRINDTHLKGIFNRFMFDYQPIVLFNRFKSATTLCARMISEFQQNKIPTDSFLLNESISILLEGGIIPYFVNDSKIKMNMAVGKYANATINPLEPSIRKNEGRREYIAALEDINETIHDSKFRLIEFIEQNAILEHDKRSEEAEGDGQE